MLGDFLSLLILLVVANLLNATQESTGESDRDAIIRIRDAIPYARINSTLIIDILDCIRDASLWDRDCVKLLEKLGVYRRAERNPKFLSPTSMLFDPEFHCNRREVHSKSDFLQLSPYNRILVVTSRCILQFIYPFFVTIPFIHDVMVKEVDDTDLSADRAYSAASCYSEIEQKRALSYIAMLYYQATIGYYNERSEIQSVVQRMDRHRFIRWNEHDIQCIKERYVDTSLSKSVKKIVLIFCKVENFAFLNMKVL